MAVQERVAGSMLFLGVPYKLRAGPVHLPEDPHLDNGTNCQLLAHAFLLHNFGITLPVDQRSQEMFHNTRGLFREVTYDESWRCGDLFFFGSAHLTDYRRLHVAIYLRQEAKGDSLLLHASYKDGAVTTWPLTKFFTEGRYSGLYAIRRHKGLEQASLVLPG